MNQAKKDAMDILSKMSDESTWEEIMYELYVIKKVADARENVAKGKYYTHEEAKKRLVQL